MLLSAKHANQNTCHFPPVEHPGFSTFGDIGTWYNASSVINPHVLDCDVVAPTLGSHSHKKDVIQRSV